MADSKLYLCNNQIVLKEDNFYYENSLNRMSAMNLSPSPSGDSQESTMTLSTSPPMSVTLSPRSMQNLLGMSLEEQACNNIDMLFSSKPYLTIKEEPIGNFRFRYKSEMMGTHGSLSGKSSDRPRKKSFPSVELKGFGGNAIIRCSLYTAQKDESERTLHTHRLVVKVGFEEMDDPHAIQVSPQIGYIAVFQGMGIIHTAKKHIADELIKKKRFRLLEKLKAKNINALLSKKDEVQIREDAEAEARVMDLNVVTLGFEACIINENGTLTPICKPVFSQPIYNMKSALTGELKICRIDRHVSRCSGGDEVFMLVEKVGKKNIKVKFFEMDDDDNEIWCDFGKFSELDVHHQFAIVFRTPPYRLMDIEESREVLLQLYRPSDGACSEPIRFTYRPTAAFSGSSRKRPRTSDLIPIPMTTPACNGFDYNPTANFANPMRVGASDTPMLSEDVRNNELLEVNLLSMSSMSFEQILNDSTDQLPSAEFRDFMQNLSGTNFEGLLRSPDSLMDDMDLATDSATSSKRAKDLRKRQAPARTNAALPTGAAPRVVPEATTVSGDDLLKNVTNRLLMVMKTTPPPQAADVAAGIRDLFEKKSDEGDCALHIAVRPENKQYLEKILGIISRSRTIQSEALQLYISDILNSRNKKLETPLNRAVYYDQPATVAALLKGGACPNKTDINGYTPLHVAVRCSHNKCLAELLNKKNYERSSKSMYTNIKSEDGCSPLHLATRKRNVEAVRLLLEAGANVNEKDKTNGRTALHIAVEEESAEMLRLLVSQPTININEQNFSGNTALHMACVIGGNDSVELCKILLDAKANPMIVNYNTEVQEEDRADEPEPNAGSMMEVVIVKQEPGVDPEDIPEPIGQTSIDLASDKTILELLQSYVTSRMTIKTEPVDLDKVKQEETWNLESSDHDPIVLFDTATRSKLCDVLDRTGGWEILAELLDYKFLVGSIGKSDSPSKLLFNYAEIRGTSSVSEIREYLVLFSEHEAVAVIDEMLEKETATNLHS